MKKFNFSLLAGLLLLISASVCAENTPEKVQEVLENGFDGAIIGTELIRRLNVSLDEFKSFITTVHQVI